MAVFFPSVMPYSVESWPLRRFKRKSFAKRFSKWVRLYKKTTQWRSISLTTIRDLKAGVAIHFHAKGWPTNKPEPKATAIVIYRHGLEVIAINRKQIFVIQLTASHPGAADWRRTLALRKLQGIERDLVRSGNAKALAFFREIIESRKNWSWSESEFNAHASDIINAAYAVGCSKKEIRRMMLSSKFIQLIHVAYQK